MLSETSEVLPGFHGEEVSEEERIDSETISDAERLELARLFFDFSKTKS